MIGIDTFFDGVVDNSNKPSDYEMALYMFWDKGIGFEEFERLPLPYILSIIKSQNHINKENEKESKKRRK